MVLNNGYLGFDRGQLGGPGRPLNLKPLRPPRPDLLRHPGLQQLLMHVDTKLYAPDPRCVKAAGTTAPVAHFRSS